MNSTHVFMVDESQLPLRCAIQVVGRTGRIATNDRDLLDVLNGLCAGANDAVAFRLLVSVHQEASSATELPHFRGLHQLVFVQFGPSNLFLFDILGRTVSAAITAELAHNRAFWLERLIPIAIGVFGAGIGVLPLHAACLSVAGRGVLIAGASGAGKSTLSVALARMGAHFISDDWTYVAYDDAQLCAHGLRAPVKLLPDAGAHFPELHQHDLRISLNGELAYELSPGSLNLHVEDQCSPRCLVFYERLPTGGPEFTRLSGTQVPDYIRTSIEPLPPQLSCIAEVRERIASRLADLPCYRFRHSGNPNTAAQALYALISPREVRMSA